MSNLTSSGGSGAAGGPAAAAQTVVTCSGHNQERVKGKGHGEWQIIQVLRDTDEPGE